MTADSTTTADKIDATQRRVSDRFNVDVRHPKVGGFVCALAGHDEWESSGLMECKCLRCGREVPAWMVNFDYV